MYVQTHSGGEVIAIPVPSETESGCTPSELSAYNLTAKPKPPKL